MYGRPQPEFHAERIFGVIEFGIDGDGIVVDRTVNKCTQLVEGVVGTVGHLGIVVEAIIVGGDMKLHAVKLQISIAQCIDQNVAIESAFLRRGHVDG